MTSAAFIFAGGGTGGHLFPGLALVECIRPTAPDADAIFIASERRIDAEILESSGERSITIPAKPFGVKPRAMASFLKSWGPSVRASRQTIRELKKNGREPIVAAMGGFVAPAVVQAARAERVPVVMFNLDATPGLANRWIAKRAEQVLTSYAIPRWPNATRIPPIVRAEAIARDDAAACRQRLGLEPDAPTLAALGGSQGATTINRAMAALIAQSDHPLSGWQVIHQSGLSDQAELAAAYERAGLRAVVQPFFDAVGDVWGAASLAIARAGAGTVAEAWANTTPAIFLPYPHHRDHHQAANAQPLVDRGGAIVIRDVIDASENARALADAIRNIGGADGLVAMAGGLRSLGPANGAAVAADALLKAGPRMC